MKIENNRLHIEVEKTRVLIEAEQICLELSQLNGGLISTTAAQAHAYLSEMLLSLVVKERLCAWAIKHDSHGLVLDTLCFLPEGEVPDTKANWCRLPWLDERDGMRLTDEGLDRVVRRVKELGAAWGTTSADVLSMLAELRERRAADLNDHDLYALRILRLRSATKQFDFRTNAQPHQPEYELGRADERINVNDVLLAVEMVIRDFPGTSPEEIKRVLKLVRDYRAQTEEIKQLGREKGWYPR